MKKTLLAASICAIMASSAVYGQHTQSFSFTGPSTIDITTTNTFTLSVNLTFSGYSALGLSYWLEVQNALAPFLTITHITDFIFVDGPPPPVPIPFMMGGGGYDGEGPDLGNSSVNNPVPPGTYHIADLTFTLALLGLAGIGSGLVAYRHRKPCDLRD